MAKDIFSTPKYFFNDQEATLDLINNHAISEILVTLINEESRPITIGIHGDWGSGKSSILKMLEKELENDKDRTLCIKFNGWQFQGFEDAKIAIIEEISTQLINSKTLWKKSKDKIAGLLNSINWMKFGKLAADITIVSQGGPPISPYLNMPDSMKVKEDDIQGELKGKIEEFRKNFVELFNETGYNRLVVLIDDLDRCLPKTVIETLEAIRLFLFLPRTVFVIGADEKMIEYAVKNHFPQLDSTNSASTYSRNYLEKLIQLPIRLTNLGASESHTYISLLLLGSMLGEDNESFLKIRNEAIKMMQHPWDGRYLNISFLQDNFREKDFKDIQPILEIITEINPILSRGTRGNPRQIKRFLSTLNIRLQLAEAKGFGKLIKTKILAKIMLAEAFLPVMFDRLVDYVSKSQNGICKEIQMAENGKEGEKENALLIEKNTSEDISNWISISPKLGNIDLRPYLFVMKDSVKFSSPEELSPKLNNLLEKLLGGQFNAASCLDELSKTPVSDIYKLFERLKDIFLAEQDFSKQPNSYWGIQNVVSQCKELDIKYVEMLDSIPVDKYGIWVAGGHDSVVKTQEGKNKLKELLSKWVRENDKNKNLASVLKEIKGA